MSRYTPTQFTKEQLKDDLLVDRLTVPNTVIIGAASEDSRSIVDIGKEYEKRHLYHKALAWYRIAADKNSWLALNHIGKLYEEGLGVTRNYYTAFEWYLKSAKLSKCAGRESISDMFKKGRGVDVNYYKAIEWLLKAKDVDDKIREIAGRCDHIDAIEDKKALTLLINETDDIIRESREKELKQMQDQYETYIVEKASMEKESSIKDQNIESLKQDLVRLQSSPKHLQKESKTLIDLMEDNHKKDKDLLTKELINTKERIIGLQHGLNNKEHVLLSIEDKMDALRQSLSRNKVLKESKAKLERELKGRDSKMASLEQEIQVLQDESKQSINEDSDIVDLLKNIIQSRENEIELVKENSQLLLLQEAQRAALLEKENRELKMKIQECGEHDADNRKNDSVRIKMEKIEQDDDDAIRKRRRLASDTF